MKKKVLISGGSGFIGSFIVKQLIRKKYFVINVDKLSYASQKSVIKHKSYKFIKSDISHRNKLEKIFAKFKPDFVINCAAESHVDNSIKNPNIFIISNVIGTLSMLQVSLKYNIKKFIHISTDEVFGELSLGKKKFTLKSPYNPKSPYSASKASSDHLVRSFGNTYGLNYIITNCSNNYGPFQYPEKLIPVIINCCIKKKSIPIYGKGINVRDWIYVEDHSEAVIKALENSKQNETYLIGSNFEMSNLDIVKLICKKFKKITKSKFDYLNLISYVKDRKGHDLRYAIDNSYIKKKLKWKPKTSFDKGIEKTIKFYVKNISRLNKIYNN